MNLYEINKGIQEIYDNIEIDEETGEVLLNEDALNELELAKEEKIEATALYIRSIKAEKDAIRTEKKRLDKKLKALDNKEDRLKSYLAYGCGKEKFKSALCTISFRDITHATLDEDMWEANPQYVLTEMVEKKKLNEEALIEDLKSGKAIEGAELVERTSVTIR